MTTSRELALRVLDRIRATIATAPDEDVDEILAHVAAPLQQLVGIAGLPDLSPEPPTRPRLLDATRAEDLMGKIGDEISYLSLAWKVLEGILDAKHAGVIERAAPGFFSTVDLALQRDVILSLSRLTDPAATGPHENASLFALVAVANVSASSEQKQRLQDGLQRLRESVAHFRRFRMKHLAHSDLAHTLGLKVLPQDGRNREGIRKALVELEDLFRALAQQISPLAVPLPTEVWHNGGVNRLMRLLQYALDAVDLDSDTVELE